MERICGPGGDPEGGPYLPPIPVHGIQFIFEAKVFCTVTNTDFARSLALKLVEKSLPDVSSLERINHLKSNNHVNSGYECFVNKANPIGSEGQQAAEEFHLSQERYEFVSDYSVAACSGDPD